MHVISFPKFLNWAFAVELAHHERLSTPDRGGYGSTWGAMAMTSLLGCLVDGSSTPAHQLARPAVHPDALKAAEAVMMLPADPDLVRLPRGWNPFPDLDDPHGLIAATVTAVLDRRAMREPAALMDNLIALVISCAVMGKEPEWRVEQPEFQVVRRYGQPAWFLQVKAKDAFGRDYVYEVDGYNRRAGRPKPGAYRKYEFTRPFEGAVQSRIDWYLWARAMNRVAERLEQESLVAHRIAPWRADCEIWLRSQNSGSFAQAPEIAAK